jgi:hypothetical protein
MHYLLKFSFPNDRGNDLLRDPTFGAKMQDLMKEIKAEAVYLTAVDGQRGGYVVTSMADASEIPIKAEPFFYWLKADLEFIPVMTPEEMMKAGPAIDAVVKKWG